MSTKKKIKTPSPSSVWYVKLKDTTPVYHMTLPKDKTTLCGEVLPPEFRPLTELNGGRVCVKCQKGQRRL